MHQMDESFDKNRAVLAGVGIGAKQQQFSTASAVGGGGLIDWLVRYDPLPLIHPDNAGLRCWQILLVAMIGFNILCVPYDLSFGIDSGGPAEIISYLSDCVFLLDILITLHIKLVIEYQVKPTKFH